MLLLNNSRKGVIGCCSCEQLLETQLVGGSNPLASTSTRQRKSPRMGAFLENYDMLCYCTVSVAVLAAEVPAELVT